MKSFPSKFKKKLSGIFSDITPKQFFNLNYFDAHEHRCCLCGRLLDHDAKELPVAEIEHLFPQSKFPQLILCISNYIPCCSNCNKIKKSSFFSCKKEFIEDLKQNKNVITRGDLQGIVEARCKKTGEDEENILKKIDEKNENKSGGKV